jgi:tRNA-splicing ligase RtcB (3'-phosphate/5'-hydroxy nucleic acid ligase)
MEYSFVLTDRRRHVGPTKDGDLLVWGIEHIEENTLDQARRSAALPFVEKPLALMPDAHFGIGATVGSVIAARGAIVPAAVGVDIGCGMVALRSNLVASDLPDDLNPLLSLIEERVPSGVGKGHDPLESDAGEAWWDANPAPWLDAKLVRKAITQFGSLGSGNHFVEVCLDGQDRVWIVLHSGSRGVGNQLAQRHIETARKLMERWHITLEDRDLAYLPEETDEFGAYWKDLDWSQRYAFGNREQMAGEVFRSLRDVVPRAEEVERISCHHNYTAWENHHGKDLMVTRKGAIRAHEGDLGVIPGSMGTRSYIVEGLGNPASYCSCSHGAGRRMSRGQARKTLTARSLTEAMGDRTWLKDQAEALLDEHPSSYKDIDTVMEAQRDLVRVRDELHQILNYKGT